MSAERSPVSCSDLGGRFPHLAPLPREHEPGDRHEDQDQERETRVHVEHRADEDDDLEVALAESDERAAGGRADERCVVEKAREQSPECTFWIQFRSARESLREHLQAQIGDEAVAEIGDGDVGDVFRHGLDDRHDHDRRGDPVDHLRVLGDEHVVGGPLNEERDGAGRGGGQKHGERSERRAARSRGRKCSRQMRITISLVV